MKAPTGSLAALPRLQFFGFAALPPIGFMKSAVSGRKSGAFKQTSELFYRISLKATDDVALGYLQTGLCADYAIIILILPTGNLIVQIE